MSVLAITTMKGRQGTQISSKQETRAAAD
jgi:hypothetical protein